MSVVITMFGRVFRYCSRSMGRRLVGGEYSEATCTWVFPSSIRIMTHSLSSRYGGSAICLTCKSCLVINMAPPRGMRVGGRSYL